MEWNGRGASGSLGKMVFLLTCWCGVFRFGDGKHVGGGGLHAMLRTSDVFSGGVAVDEYVDIESRVLERVEVYGEEIQGGTADDVTTIIYAAMQPAPGGEGDLDAWYRDEHNEQMSKEPGYKRTTRYKPLFQTRNSGKGKPEGLDFVAFHQFGEGNKVGSEVEPLDPMTEWTKRCMAGCEKIDAAVYRKVKTLRGWMENIH
ncbi:hypothetical protein PMIN03_010124 [Paraphaeosphaeria minitans]